jgi:hypothetical protein
MKHLLTCVVGLVLVSQSLAQSPTSLPPALGSQSPPAPVNALLGAPVVSDCDFAPAPCGYRVWGGAEYLMWWFRSGQTPPLVTTGNPADNVPGALGQPGTRVLFGGDLNYGTQSGMRFTFGGWLDKDSIWGLEATGFVFQRRTIGFSDASDAAGNPPIYAPFHDTNFHSEGSLTIADPLFGFNGHIAVSSATQLWGMEANGIYRLPAFASNVHAELLFGVRYLDLRENLDAAGFLNDFVDNIQRTYAEGFNTRNQFYGGQLGGRMGFDYGRFGVEVAGLCAFGTTHEVESASGSIIVGGPGATNPGTFPGGGTLVFPTNQGQQSHNCFSVVPQAQLKLAYQLTNSVRATVGYDVLYWTNVIRPGDQIDRNLNTSQTSGGTLVGQPSPAQQFRRTDFLGQGVSFGVEFKF